jgi:hypothetical protein
VIPPVQANKDSKNHNLQPLTRWAQKILTDNQIVSPVKIKSPQYGLFQRHFEHNGHLVVFFSNQSLHDSVSTTVEFSGQKGLVPWIWSPKTGERKPQNFDISTKTTTLTLGPSKSLLLVFDKQDSGSPISQHPLALKRIATLNGPWEITYIPRDGSKFVKKQSLLQSFVESDDERVRNFAGQVAYQTSVNLHNGHYIELSDVSGGITEVYVNNKKIGTRWYGKHRFKIDNAYQKKPSQLKIIYTSTLINEVIAMRESSKTAKKWTKNISPQQQGIIGPIEIYASTEDQIK